MRNYRPVRSKYESVCAIALIESHSAATNQVSRACLREDVELNET
jgi:hypothetical protein